MKGSSCVLREQQPQRCQIDRFQALRLPSTRKLLTARLRATPISAAPHLDSLVSAISLRVQTSEFARPAPFPWMFMLFCHR